MTEHHSLEQDLAEVLAYWGVDDMLKTPSFIVAARLAQQMRGTAALQDALAAHQWEER